MNLLIKHEENQFYWFKQYLTDNLFITWLQIVINAVIYNGFVEVLNMKNELLSFVEDNEELIISKVAAFLAAIPSEEGNYIKLNHVLPILRWKHMDGAWDNVNARTAQLAGFICSALSKGNMGIIGFQKGTCNVRVVIDVPSFEKTYPCPDDISHKIGLTGSFLEQEANDWLDKNEQALSCITKPELKIASVWFERPHMEEPSEDEDGNTDEDKLKAYQEYTAKLEPCVTETAVRGKFKNRYIMDYRGRGYTSTCINTTANKQIRSLVVPAKARKVYGKLQKIDISDVSLPKL